MSARDGEQIVVACDDLDDDGAGVGAEVGAADGAATSRAGAPARVHVAGALPGERVTATVEHVSQHRPQAWARLVRVEQGSPARRPPSCRAFGACGGCILQHLDYAAQLAWKTARLQRALAGVPGAAALTVAPCVPSPRPLGYRNRSKLVCARGPGGRLVLGAYAPRSHDVVDLAGGCRIVEPPLDEVAVRLRDVLDEARVVPYDERTLTGQLRHVVLRANHAGQVLAVWVTARPSGGWAEAAAARFRAACPQVTGVVENVNRTRGNVIYGDGGADADRVLAGEGTLEDRVGALTLRLSARAFAQANREVAALAYAEIARAAGLRPGEPARVVDAYAGAGGIALTLAATGAEVIGIEEHPAAVDDAAASAALNGITTARFVAGDAAVRLGEIARDLRRADVVVLNPPRQGCAPAVLAEAARLAPRVLAYLSCDPATLSRDAAALSAGGYALRAATPFDMLPHTPHIETLALFEPR